MAARFYLDFNASHPILPEALAAMVGALRDGGGNPWSPHAEGRLARQALDLDGFAVSSGPACSSGVGRSSGVLEAMGVPPAVAARSVRLSLGPDVTEGVVSAILDVLQRVARRAGGGGT